MKHFLSILILLTAFQLVNAQNYQLFFESTTSDAALWSEIGETVFSTGCDKRDFQGQSDMDVAVWDRYNSSMVAQNAMFGWRFLSYSGTFGLDGGAVTDPDVVLGIVEGEMYAFVTYIRTNGNAGYEVWEYDQQTNLWVNYVASSNLSGNNGCSFPNVDVNLDGNIIAVWAENFEIKARAGFITGSLSANIATICSQNSNYQPDVAVQTLSGSTVGIFTYLNQTSTETHLRTQTETLADVTAATPSLGYYNVKRAVIASSESFGPPRIAAPPCNNTTFSLGDHTIVVAFNTSNLVNTYEIFGYNVFQGGVNQNIINVNNTGLPTGHDLTVEMNFEPVVGYCQQDNEIIVLWTYQNSASKYGVSATEFDVLRRRLNPDLTHINFPATPYLPFYSLVNNGLTYLQYRPSVAQRNALQTDKANYVFVSFRHGSNNNSNLIMKESQTNNYNLRKANDDIVHEVAGSKNSANVYPNPVVDNYFVVKFDDDDIYATVIIRDIIGRIVHEERITGTTIIHLETMQQGLYIVDVIAGSEKTSMKIQIIK